MRRHLLRALSVVVCLSLVTLTAIIFWPVQSTVSAAPEVTAGSLGIVGKNGAITGSCPLRHTDVRGAISGFIARVNVTQQFQNTASQKIEAVYTFPLPENAAVDDMTIQIGTRTVRGVIRKREEARAIYEHAKQTGHITALLDQERPNVFKPVAGRRIPIRFQTPRRSLHRSQRKEPARDTISRSNSRSMPACRSSNLVPSRTRLKSTAPAPVRPR